MVTKIDWEDRIGRRLRLRDLHVLSTVVQHGSMAKAAQTLRVTQPAVSKVIADLEHMLGVRLLDRSPQGVEPTIYGHALLDGGRNAFDELNQAVKNIEFLANPTVGEVRIGATVALGSGFVVAVLDRLSRRYPGVVCHLVAAESGTGYQALEDRKVDLVVSRFFRSDAEERFHVEPLYEEFQVVATGLTNPWTRKQKIKLADLMNEPWTLPPPDTLSGSVVVEAFRASGLELPKAAVITSTIPVRNALLATGRFITIVPDFVLTVPTKNPAIQALPIDLPTTRRQIGIMTLQNRTLSRVTQLFIDCAREVARSMPHRV